MLHRRTAFLVGYMGAGKTSVGRYVAERLRWAFIDLDDRIEAKAGRTVPEIFALEGEPAFRRLESETLAEVVSELSAGAPTIVALGGGAITNSANADLLQEFGATVVWLEAPVEELWRRTENAHGQRPLRRDMDEFRRRHEERLPAYSEGTIRVETHGKSVAQVAAEVAWLVSISCSGRQEER